MLMSSTKSGLGFVHLSEQKRVQLDKKLQNVHSSLSCSTETISYFGLRLF